MTHLVEKRLKSTDLRNKVEERYNDNKTEYGLNLYSSVQ